MDPVACTEHEKQQEKKMFERTDNNFFLSNSDVYSLALDEIYEICIKKGLGENDTRRVLWRRMLLEDDEPRADTTRVADNTVKCLDSQRDGGESSTDDDSGESSECGNGAADDRDNNDNNDDATNDKEGDDESEVLGVTSENCQPRVICVDVKRSLWSLYPDAEIRSDRRKRLVQILISVLKKNVERHYYQGLHELIGFVMYVMEGAAQATVIALCERLLQVHWRSFSDKGLGQSQSMLYAVHAIVAREDVELASSLELCGVAPESHYAVSWVITWYTHVCGDYDVLARIFDFLIAQKNENAVIFFTTALLLREKARIMSWIQDVHDSLGADCDDNDGLILMARVYTQLVQLPKEVLLTKNFAVVEEIVCTATKLKEKYSASVVSSMREDFLQGRVKKFGILANQKTRNSALKLLWLWLFREWREPWKGRCRITTSLVAGIIVVVFAVFSQSEVFACPNSLDVFLARFFSLRT